MRRSKAACSACGTVWAGIVFAVATMQAQPGPGFTQAPVWVAVAFSPSTGNYGASTPQQSSDAASQMALKYCAMYGARDCKVLYEYWNQCVVLATLQAAITWINSPLAHAAIGSPCANQAAIPPSMFRMSGNPARSRLLQAMLKRQGRSLV